MREELLDELIEAIYAAAHAPETWPATLQRIADAYGATTGLLFDFSVRRVRHPTRVFSDSDRFEYWTRWVERDPHVASFPRGLENPPDWARDPLVETRQGLIATRPFRAQDAVPLGSLRRSVIYADMLAPRDMVHQIVTAYFAPGRTHQPMIFNIFRGERSGPFEDDDLRSFAMLGQHVLWALELEQRGLEYSLAQSRPRRDVGVVVVDREGRVLHRDDAAARLLASDDGLSTRFGALRARRRADHDDLCRLIARCRDATGSRRSASGGGTSISRPSGRFAYEVIASRPSAAIQASLPGAAAILWVRDPESAARIERETLRQLFGLSAAEARVCAAFFECPTIPDVSRLLGISRNTVKTHLARVFDKVGVRSQGELLKRLARSPLAVADPASSGRPCF